MYFDYTLFQAINQFAEKYPILDKVATFYTTYGPLLFGCILILIWFLKSEDKAPQRKAVILAVTSTMVALFINQIVSAIHFRPRPFTHHIVNLLVDKSTDPSFPSDHATGSFALALSVLLFFNRKWGYGMMALAVLLGLSRVFVGTHYPLDILGGFVTATLGTLIVSGQRKRLKPVLNFIVNTWNKLEWKLLRKSL